MVAAPELTLADQVVLAVVGEGRTHGWAIVKQLAPDGELGRVWTLSRPLTYRAIDRLVDLGLVERSTAGRRAELRVTRLGRGVSARWLDAPVDHLRDLRTEFLLKLLLRRRSGLDVADLVERQRRRLAPAIDALASGAPDDPVDRWRQESAGAARRFLEGLANPE